MGQVKETLMEIEYAKTLALDGPVVEETDEAVAAQEAHAEYMTRLI